MRFVWQTWKQAHMFFGSSLKNKKPSKNPIASKEGQGQKKVPFTLRYSHKPGAQMAGAGRYASPIMLHDELLFQIQFYSAVFYGVLHKISPTTFFQLKIQLKMARFGPSQLSWITYRSYKNRFKRFSNLNLHLHFYHIQSFTCWVLKFDILYQTTGPMLPQSLMQRPKKLEHFWCEKKKITNLFKMFRQSEAIL